MRRGLVDRADQKQSRTALRAFGAASHYEFKNMILAYTIAVLA